MGADFIFIAVPNLSEITTLERITEIIQGGELDERLSVLADDDFDFSSAYLNTYAFEGDLAAIKSAVLDAAKDVWFTPDHREIAFWMGHVISGGMSWGDYPTDIWPQMELLSEIVDDLKGLLDSEPGTD
jgi:hypothetical protein